MAIVVLAAGILAPACGRRPVSAEQVEIVWTLGPAAPAVGPASLSLTLRTRGGQPLTGAQVRLDAYMSHPGMAPVQANAVERGAGVYDVPFSFTMAGDWVLLVEATLPQEGRLQQRIDVRNVRSPG